MAYKKTIPPNKKNPPKKKIKSKQLLKKGWQDITNAKNGTLENFFYPLFSKDT